MTSAPCQLDETTSFLPSPSISAMATAEGTAPAMPRYRVILPRAESASAVVNLNRHIIVEAIGSDKIEMTAQIARPEIAGMINGRPGSPIESGRYIRSHCSDKPQSDWWSETGAGKIKPVRAIEIREHHRIERIGIRRISRRQARR